MNFNKPPSIERENSTPKNEYFNRLVEKAKKLLPSISPKALFGIALISGLSLQEIKAQKIEVPDKDAMGAYDQVKTEADIWKSSLGSVEYRNRLLSLLNNDSNRTDQIIKARKDNLENSVINILTARSYSDTLGKYVGKPYPILAFSDIENKTIQMGTRLGNKKKKTDYVRGLKNRQLMYALYSTSHKHGLAEGTTTHELGHTVTGDSSSILTKEEQELILSKIPKEILDRISSPNNKRDKILKDWIVNPEEIYSRLAELSYYFTSNGLEQGKLTPDNILPLLKSSPLAIESSYMDLKKSAKITREDVVTLLNTLPLPASTNTKSTTKY